MKKLGIIVASAFMLTATVSAQTGNEEKIYGPEEGKWSLSVGVDPITNYIGNLFNGKTNNTLNELNGEPVAYKNQTGTLTTISGKYMLTDEFGIRANVGINSKSETIRKYVTDQYATSIDPFSDDKVIDSKKTRSTGASIALGAEQRLTSNAKRLQAYVGGGVVWSFETVHDTYTYGNEITDLNQKPENSFNNYTSVAQGSIPSARPLETNKNNALYHTFGVYGTVGVEYFLTQAISIGAEMNLSVLYTVKGQHSSKYEGYNVSTQKVEEYTDLDTPSSHAFEVSTKNIGANLLMSFYF